MVKISGSLPEFLQSSEMLLRIKPSLPWLGVAGDLRIFKIKNGKINIELPPTPVDRVYLVDVVEVNSESSLFSSQESWIIPLEDCNIEEIRNFSLSHLKFLETENKKLKKVIEALAIHNEVINEFPLTIPQQNIEIPSQSSEAAKKITRFFTR